MVWMDRVLIALTLALLASSALLPVSDAVKKPSSAPRKEDVPYIKCQVCEKLASRLHQLVKEKQQQISPKKISEYEIIEIAENVCNLKKEEADWMLKIDIVEKGDKLELVEQEEEGMCNSECKTIETACQKVIGYSDTDVAEYIFKSKPDLVSLVNHLCKDLTDACSKNPPPVPKDRVPGEPFVAKPSKDAEMDKIMRSMQGMPGAPGMKVYSREDIEKYKDNLGNLGNEVDGDDDDDEEEDEKFPKNLGKVLKEKENKKEEWKNTITKEIKKKGVVLKRHAQTLTQRRNAQRKRRAQRKSEDKKVAAALKRKEQEEKKKLLEEKKKQQLARQREKEIMEMKRKEKEEKKQMLEEICSSQKLLLQRSLETELKINKLVLTVEDMQKILHQQQQQQQQPGQYSLFSYDMFRKSK